MDMRRDTESRIGPNRDPETLTTDEMRQGTTGHNVRYVLMFSLVGAVIALVVAWVLVT